MKAAIYSRKSKFSPTGDSIENQIQMCKNYAQLSLRDQNITEFLIYEDEGFTGANTNRPEFQRLMVDLNSSKFDILMCYRLDRISRSVKDFSNTLDIILNNGVDFVSIKEKFDTTTPMGRAMIYMSSVFAQVERETTAERVRDGMLQLSKSGRWLGGTHPLGYTSKQITYIDQNMTERSYTKLSAVVEEAELIQLIFDTYIELKSLRKLETYLLNNFYRSRKGIKFSMTTLKKILTNTVYVRSSEEVMSYLVSKGVTVCGKPDGIHGLLTYNKLKNCKSKKGSHSRRLRDTSEWISSVSNHEGIIMDTDWIKVQEILHGNKDKFTVSARTHNALLTGIIKCDKCGSRMRILHGPVSKKTGKKMFYYACTLKKDSQGQQCDNKNCKADEIDSIVLNSIKDIGRNKDDFINELIDNNKLASKKISSTTLNQSLAVNIAAKKAQIDNLVTKLSLDSDLTDVIFTKIKSLKSELKELQLKEHDIEQQVSDLKEEEINLSFIKILLDSCSFIDTLSFDEKKNHILGLVDTITWNGDTNKLDINFIGSMRSKKK